MGLRVQDSGFRLEVSISTMTSFEVRGLCVEVKVLEFGVRVQDLGLLGFWGLGFGISGSECGFRVSGLGYAVTIVVSSLDDDAVSGF